MGVDDPRQDPGDGPDARLQALDQRLQDAHRAEAARNGTAKVKPRGYSQGNRVLAELIGGLAGGALFGWLLDRLLGTAPWGLLVLLFLGMAVAFRNIIRIANERPD